MPSQGAGVPTCCVLGGLVWLLPLGEGWDGAPMLAGAHPRQLRTHCYTLLYIYPSVHCSLHGVIIGTRRWYKKFCSFSGLRPMRLRVVADIPENGFSDIRHHPPPRLPSGRLKRSKIKKPPLAVKKARLFAGTKNEYIICTISFQGAYINRGSDICNLMDKQQMACCG